MSHIFHVPSPPLDTLINCLYFPDGSVSIPHPREKIMPMPLLDIKFNLSGMIEVSRSEQGDSVAACADSWVVGLWSTYHVVKWPSELNHFGVSLKPGGAYLLLHIPLSELHNQVVPLEAIWGPFAAEVRERLFDAPTIQARFALLERLLSARLCEVPYGLRMVQYAVNQIAMRSGDVSIRDLSDHLGISQKHLIAQFKQMVGATPKALARLYRFEQILQRIDPIQPVDWTRIAHQFHYYDQSHFNREFEMFTGHNPGDYLRLRRRAYAENPDRAKNPRILPTG